MVNSDVLPSDVVAVESKSRGYLFYVNNKFQLAYLLGPEGKGKDFQVVVIKDAVNKPIYVNSQVTQIAAISWVNPQSGSREIRVYYSAKDTKILSEVYLTNEGIWTEGALHQGNKFAVKAGSSISATVTRGPDSKPTGIKVYAAKDDEFNQYDLPNIAVFQTDFGFEWNDPSIITSKVASY
ncbi:hypothetical protein OQA88_2672 [Cercophora sp. LCS_1]